MKEYYEIAVKEIISFMDKCGCSECLETKRLLLMKNPELNTTQ